MFGVNFAGDSGQMAFSRKAFINFLLPIIGLLLVAGALFLAFPSAAAYASCTPGATCDSAGQTCTYFLPTDTGCTSTLTCNSYNQSSTRNVPHDTACYCMQNLQITQVNDQSLAGNGAEASFKFSVRESNQVNYLQETVYSNLLLFGSASLSCGECSYDNDCDYDEYCDTSRHVCRDDYNHCDWYEYWDGNSCDLRSGYCYSSGDCGWDEYCSGNTCSYTYDYYDHGCSYWQSWNGYMCVSDYNDYDNYCTYDSQCGSNQYCDEYYNVCRNSYSYYDYCDSDYDCGSGEYCDEYYGYCRSSSYYGSDSCYDSDGGQDYYTDGYATGNGQTVYDACMSSSTGNEVTSGDAVREGYCSGGDVEQTVASCAYGCYDGACRSSGSYSDYSPSIYSSNYDYDLTCSNDASGDSYCQSVFGTMFGHSFRCVSGQCMSTTSSTPSCGSTECCKSQYGSNYYYSSSSDRCLQYTAPSGGYSCSSQDELICGLPCSEYASIDAECGAVLKSYCSSRSVNYLSVGEPCKECGTTAQCSLTPYYDSSNNAQKWMINSFDNGENSAGGYFCKYDPPVTCSAYLSGPGLSRTLVGTYNFDTLPNVDYPGTVNINQSYFHQQGTYSLDMSCNIALPTGSVACSSGCTSAGSTINFHVDTCNTAISVETDKVQYASGEVMNIRGTLRNNTLPIGTTVYVKVQDMFGNTQATIPVTASGGEFSTNWIVPNTLASGSFRINASAQFNTCPAASSNLIVGIASCDVTVASALTQTGSASPATVTGTVYNHGTSLSGANVTVKVYKDGSLFKQAYVGSLFDGTFTISVPGPFGDGTYSAQVDAKYLTCPSASSSATSSSGIMTFSGDCNTKLRGGVAKFSSTVPGVQVTGYLADNAGTRSKGTYSIEVRNKAGTVVGSTSGTTTSTGDISATVANIAAGDYDVVVTSVSGSCTSTDKLSLGGDFQVSLISSPACGSASSTYQVKLKNTQSSSMTVSMAYSSASQVTLSGPSSVVLPANGEAVISVTVGFADTVSGGSLGIVNFNNSNSASSQSLQLPICASGNLRVNIVDKLRTGSIGQRLCYNFQVENRGAESGTVTLSYDSGPYYVDGSFSLQQFRLSSYETRDDLQFCATVPNAQFYTLPIVLRATAPFSIATDTVAMSSGASSTDISIGFSGCPNIAKGVQYPITLYNNGEAANYAVEVTDNGYLHPLVAPQVINNFARYSSQVVTVTVNPTGLLAANYVTLYIRKDGAIVKQQQLCFATIGAVNASSQYASSLYAVNRSSLSQVQSGNVPDVTIYAPQVDYNYNGTHFIANASFLVKNNENRSLLYEANVNLPEGWAATYYPRAATIRPGDMREFTVAISATNFQKRVYTASIAIVDPIGRTASAPFTIDATSAGSSGILTGFFSAAGASSFGVALVILLAIGAVLFYGIRKHEETAA